MDLLTVHTKHAPVSLRKVNAFIIPGPVGDLLLGMTESNKLGYPNPVDWFDELTKDGPIDIEAYTSVDGISIGQDMNAQRVRLLSKGLNSLEDDTPSDGEADQPEEGARASEVDPERQQQQQEQALIDMLKRAEKNGAPRHIMSKLTEIVFKYRDVFRTELGQDEPAKVEPMLIEIVDNEVMSKMQRARRFSPLQMDFIDDHVKLLLEMGVIKRVNHPLHLRLC